MRPIVVSLAATLAATASGEWGIGIRPNDEDPAIDCGLRRLALDFANAIAPAFAPHAETFDALQLGPLCDAERPEHEDGAAAVDRPGVAPRPLKDEGDPQELGPRQRRIPQRTGAAEQTYDCVLSVDPTTATTSSDACAAPDGACATVAEAVAASRYCAAGASKAVLLAPGTHYLAETVALDARDANLAIAGTTPNAADTILSGGVDLTGALAWDDASSSANTMIRTATLTEAQAGVAFTASTSSLWVNGRREIRARHPNGDPETSGAHTDPSGWFGLEDASAADDWSAPELDDGADAAEKIERDDVRATPYYSDFKVSTGVSRYDPPYSFWGPTYRPTKLNASRLLADLGATGSDIFGAKKKHTDDSSDDDDDDVVVHAIHGRGWGGWQFRVVGPADDDDDDDPEVVVVRGGQQEARGAESGGAYYLENHVAFLDAEREFHYDRASRTLRYYARQNETLDDASIVASHLATLVDVANASNVAFRNLTFAHTRPTFLESYRVPSGGDWAIHASAALRASDGVAGLRVEDCVFDSLGGNALLVEGRAEATRVARTDFVRVGASGVVLLGRTRYDDGDVADDDDDDTAKIPALMDGRTNANVPANTTVEACRFREIGVYEKQTAGVVQFLAARTTVRDSVFFNGPRAAINLNDGFYGDHLVDRCLLFNWVRETSDHGALNTWDRQPYASTAAPDDDDDDPYHVAALPSRVTRSFVVNNYAGNWPLDHDDGSQHFVDTANVLVWGGAKNYEGFEKQSLGNAYINVDLGRKGQDGCAMDDSHGAHDTFANNTCLVVKGKLYSAKPCNSSNLNDTMPASANNRFYTTGAETSIPCDGDTATFTLREYQDQFGMDLGSTVAELPDAVGVLAIVSTLLGLPQPPPPAAA